MKCPKCGGYGKLLKKEKGKACYEVSLSFCDKCHGSGEVEITNEEWLKSMNTEQFAEALAWIEDRGELPTVRKENVKAFEEWLKKPYKE